MKYLGLTLAFALTVLFVGCGAGHPTIKSVEVNPHQATASSPNGEVGFTATGVFANNDTRELTAVDDLDWITSNSLIATVDSTTGEATCKAPGTVIVTVMVPADLTITVNNGVHNTSNKVSGTATLVCT